MNKLLKNTLLITGLCLSSTSQADEHIFNYVYGAETIPKGGMEFQTMLTNRWDKDKGSYNAQELQAELEYGITDRLQVSGYLLGLRVDHKGAFPNDEEGEPLYPDRTKTAFRGVKSQIKYNILSPYLNDGWGLALMVEPSYQTRFKVDGSKTKQFEVEFGALVQKNLLDDQLILAYNFIYAREKRILVEDGDAVEQEQELYNYLGATYRVAPQWYVGLEARHHMDVLKVPNGNTFKKNQYSMFVGPTVHYAAKEWWATLTYFRQIQGNPTYAASVGPTTGGSDDNLHLDENEKNELRLRVGFDF